MAGRLNHDIVRRVKEEISIADIAGDYLSLRKSGRNLLAVCPFHPEKTPSFTVNEEKGIFYCFGCHEKGDIINFIMKIEGLEFTEAVRFLAGKAGIPVTFSAAGREKENRRQVILRLNLAAALYCHRFLIGEKSAEPARKYLEKRGLAGEVITTFRVGWAPSRAQVEKALESEGFSRQDIEAAGLRFYGRVVFPIVNLSGECAGFGARTLESDTQPKYLNSPENDAFHKGRLLYGLYESRQSIRESDRVVLVEGYLDLIKTYQAGITNVAAGLGTALTPEQASLIKRFTGRVTLLYDGDSAGRQAVERNLETLFGADLEVSVALLPEGLDPDSFIDENGAPALLELIGKGVDPIEFKIGQALGRQADKSSGARIFAARELMPLLSAVPSPLRRSHYLALAAEKLGLPEEGLRGEFIARGKKPRFKREKAGPANSEQEKNRGVRLAEEIALGCALREPGARPRVLECLGQEELVCPESREIIEILGQMEKNATADGAREICPDRTGLIDRLCQLAEDHGLAEGTPGEKLEGYLKRILDFRREKEIRRHLEGSGIRKQENPDLEALAALQEMVRLRHREPSS